LVFLQVRLNLFNGFRARLTAFSKIEYEPRITHRLPSKAGGTEVRPMKKPLNVSE